MTEFRQKIDYNLRRSSSKSHRALFLHKKVCAARNVNGE